MRLQFIGPLARWRKLRHVLGIWLVIALTAGAPWADAAIYYVNATTGSNGDDGLSSGNAWETITYALSQATSGDTINVEEGLYDNPTNGETFPLELVNGVALIGAGPGTILTLNITNGGSGYDTPPDVGFSGGGGNGIGAEAFAVIDGGIVTELVLVSGGGGFTSVPTVDFTGGTPDVAATATATVGDGVSTISSPDGTPLFLNDEALDSNTRLSGFLLKHDASGIDDNFLEFEVGNFAQSPRIDNNAFVEGKSDTAVYFTDESTGDGSFTATIEDNVMYGLNQGVWLTVGGAVGGTGDNFSPTIQNNTFTRVYYPLDLTFSADQGGDVAPVMRSNTAWYSNNDVYVSASLGSDFDTLAVTIANNTFNEASYDSIYSGLAFLSGAHTFSPVYTNNTITSPAGNGFAMLLSISSATGGEDHLLNPIISGNTITDAGEDGIYLSVSPIAVQQDFTATISPTINSNTITDAAGDGISLTLSVASEGNFVSNLTISGNRIERSGEQAIYVELSEFYDTDLDDLTTNWLISNNTLIDNVQEGISLTISSLTGVGAGDTGLMNNTITGNDVDGNGDSGIYIKFSPDDTSTVEGNFTVEGNTTTANDDPGIYVNFSSGASADQSLTVRGNTITGGGSYGIQLSLLTQSSIGTNDLLIADNVIENNGNYGIYVEAVEDSPDPVIFSCNTITGNAFGGVYIDDVDVTLDGGGIGVNFGDGTVESPGYNLLYDNGDAGTFDFFNANALPIRAENNYWGTTSPADPASIDAHISDGDGGEDPGGEVDFTPYLEAESEITRAIGADIAFSSVEDDADSSGSPTIGDTLRFCTTVTGQGNCGSGLGVTVTIPVPANTTLVPGSVTTDHGAVDVNATDIVITGVVLEPGEVANICFDVVADSGTEVTADVTADGDSVEEVTDSATVVLEAAAAALPAEIPTVHEWGLIIMSCLLMLIGLFTIRRGGLAALLAAALLLFPAPGANAAKPGSVAKQSKEAKVKHLAVTIRSVSVADGKVTIELADGTSHTVATGDLEIKDQRVSREEKKSVRVASQNQKQSAQGAMQSASRSGPNKVHESRFTPESLAGLISSPSAKSSGGQSAVLKIKGHGTRDPKVKLTLYSSVSQAQSAVTERDQAEAAAQSRKVAPTKSK